MKFVAGAIQKFLFFAFLGLTIFGGHSLWVCFRSREPEQTDVAALVSSTNRAAWLIVKDCEYTALDAVGWTNALIQSFQEVFIPVRYDAHDTNSPVPLLIATRDRKTVAALNALQKAESLESKLKTLATAPELGFMKRDIAGLVRGHWQITRDEMQAIRSAFPALTENFIVLDEGKSPSAIKGVVMIAFGLLFLFIAAAIGLLVEKVRSNPVGPPPVIPPTDPPPLPRTR